MTVLGDALIALGLIVSSVILASTATKIVGPPRERQNWLHRNPGLLTK